jgi:6,7-dimethyl-8-ribityllumazine synthase
MTRPRAPRAAPPPERVVLARSARLACVVSSYHAELTDSLLDSALCTLAEHGIGRERVDVVRAPGTFELPVIAQRLAARADVCAVLCFGLVLKGETEHDRYIAEATAHGLMEVALAHAKPVLFGVLTCATHAQAVRRARPASQGGLDKGREVALAALAALGALRDAGGTAARRRARP